MKIRTAYILFSFCLVAGILSGCGAAKPEPPVEIDIEADIKEMIPQEEVELVGQIDEETYLFRSCIRDLEFEVRVEPERDLLFGMYTGNYVYRYDGYEGILYGLYEDRVEQLIKDHGFENYESYDICPYIGVIQIAARDPLKPEDVENINDFLLDLREITIEEQQYHHDGYIFKYELEFYWITNGKEKPRYTLAYANGYQSISTVISGDYTDEQLDIMSFEWDILSNSSINRDLCGVLITVDYDQDEIDELMDVSGNSDDATDYIPAPDDPESASDDPEVYAPGSSSFYPSDDEPDEDGYYG